MISGQISFCAGCAMVCCEMFSLSLHIKVQNRERDQGNKLAGEEFHSSFSGHSAPALSDLGCLTCSVLLAVL